MRVQSWIDQPPAAKKTSRMQRLLEKIEAGATKVTMAIQDRPWIGKVGVTLVTIVGVAFSITVVGAFVYVAATNLDVTEIVVLVLFGVLVSAAALLALRAAGVVEFVGGRVIVPTARRVKAGGLGLFDVLAEGYYAVKTNTCPRIELSEK
jgi:hypothetical protein